mmetsp:Transcript_1677/g.4891  ORF Transcript_1677/g.4891 Transcript_1677/m.4891 type:complete len:207 (-) Transcript_1677:126-746(-)
MGRAQPQVLNFGLDAIGRLERLDFLTRQNLESDRLGRFYVRGEVDGAEGTGTNLAGGPESMMRRLLMFRRAEFKLLGGTGRSGDTVDIEAIWILVLFSGLGLAATAEFFQNLPAGRLGSIGTANRRADVLLLVAGVKIDSRAGARQLVLLLGGFVVILVKYLAGRSTPTKPVSSIFIALDAVEIGEVGQQLPRSGQPYRHCENVAE